MQLYTVMPLLPNHVEEAVQDIARQVKDGIADCPLFMMTLVPEGNPPVDKAGALCEAYALYKEKLDALGIPSGVLLQATIGHGWVLSEPFPFQHLVNLSDGKENEIVCPYDKGFQQYIEDACERIAACHPSVVMIDDDLRLLGREGCGCACPLHMAKFPGYTRSRLKEALFAGQDAALVDAFVETQRESILQAAQAMRRGFDKVDPTLRGIFCCVGNNAEFAGEAASILAGKGNSPTVRINNANYTAQSARGLSSNAHRAASQIAKLDGVCTLAETDTCPQNRYSKGAKQLHAHYVASLLEGVQGAKHWITRLHAHEMQSGEAYRKILAKYSAFYRSVADMVPSIAWQGLRMPIRKKAKYVFGKNWGCVAEHYSVWGENVFERMGLPMYFSAVNGGVLCLEGDLPDLMDEAEILEALGGKMLLSSDSAKRLIDRGFGKYLGITLAPHEGKTPSYEIVCGEEESVQSGYMALDCRGAKEMTTVYHDVGKGSTRLFAGSTLYRNELGGMVAVFCGTPAIPYGLNATFSFLNESRKKQMAQMMWEMDALPCYALGDEEMYCKAGTLPDGSMFFALFNLGLDPLENIRLFTKDVVRQAQCLSHEGKWENVPFTAQGNVLTLPIAMQAMDVLLLKLQ